MHVIAISLTPGPYLLRASCDYVRLTRVSRFELFLLADGEKKIEEKPFTGTFLCQSLPSLLRRPHADLLIAMSNTSDFVIKKEDHTLGNLLAEHLKMHRNVMVAGYKSKIVPYHPQICGFCAASVDQGFASCSP